MGAEKPGDVLIERLKIAVGCGNYAGLVSRLGVTRAMLSESRKQGRLGEELKFRLIEHGINPDWVEQGSGRPFLDDLYPQTHDLAGGDEAQRTALKLAALKFNVPEPRWEKRIYH